MSLESLCALATSGTGDVGHVSRGVQFPHLDRLVQAARDQVATVGRECYTIHTISVAIGTFQSLNQISGVRIPHPHTLVERAGRDQLSIGGDGDSRDAVFDAQSEYVLAGVDIPYSYGSVTTARGDMPTIAGKVERVDILLVTVEGMPYHTVLNVPDLLAKG